MPYIRSLNFYSVEKKVHFSDFKTQRSPISHGVCIRRMFGSNWVLGKVGTHLEVRELAEV